MKILSGKYKNLELKFFEEVYHSPTMGWMFEGRLLNGDTVLLDVFDGAISIGIGADAVEARANVEEVLEFDELKEEIDKHEILRLMRWKIIKTSKVV